MLLMTLVLPILTGFYLLNFSGWFYVSMPLHSTLESIGGTIALIIAALIFMLHAKEQIFNHLHITAFSLITMGIFDIFHAVVGLGELFVWLHSLAIFFGGLIFSLVWLPKIYVSEKTYTRVPLVFALFAIGLSIISMLVPSLVPSMLDHQGRFTVNANLLNLLGGFMFVLASLFFIRQYLEDTQIENLLFAGHSMLFGSAGVLFFFSTLWDMNWWFWHLLRLLAYLISLYFMLRIVYNALQALYVFDALLLNQKKSLGSES